MALGYMPGPQSNAWSTVPALPLVVIGEDSGSPWWALSTIPVPVDGAGGLRLALIHRHS
jgi:hypothetical protein